jgi:hypothetical protein
VGFRIFGPKLNRSSNQVDGKLVLAMLFRDHSEEVPRDDVIGIDGKNLPADLLGIRQASCLVMAARRRECLLNC